MSNYKMNDDIKSVLRIRGVDDRTIRLLEETQQAEIQAVKA
ncbi:hypothetical protein [Oceanobacillus sp. CF4.6]